MRHLRHILALLMPAVLLIGGCASSDEEIPLDEDIHGVLEPKTGGGSAYEPPSGRNGLLPSEFWSPTAQNAMREIQDSALDSGFVYFTSEGVAIPKLPSLFQTDTLLATHPEVVRHLIECALGPTQSVFDPINKAIYTGWWSLAPDWISSPITTKLLEQEWVTACMVARLNKTGTHVDILLEGANPFIEVSPVYNPMYSFQESTVFGNMFNSILPVTTNKPAFLAYVCREDDLVNTCPSNGGEGWIDYRLCDNAPATCGIVDIGRCSDIFGSCFPNGEHWKCQATATTAHQGTTIGVQLLEPILPNECH